jgi:hypothetical protein
MVWDVSSSSSRDASEEEEESIPQGRLYNDTFEEDLSSKYSTSFESAQSDAIKRKNRKSGGNAQHQYVVEGEMLSAESEEGSISYQSSYSHSTVDGRTNGSLSCQTSYTDKDGSASDSESQSLYTSEGSYDSISPSSTRSTLFGRKGIPLM